jgi:hypothetical protein
MSVWNTKDDLESITYRLMDDPDGPMSEDDIANVLIGLTELHDIRCKKLFNVFEAILKERRISNENTSMEKATGREEETKSC